MLPILRNNNAKLQRELQAERAARQGIESELKAQATALKAIREAQEEDIQANAAARKAELEDELESAVEANDASRQVEIHRQLREIDKAEATASAKADVAKGRAGESQPPKVEQFVLDFIADNPWYVADLKDSGQSGKDLRRTRMMAVTMAEMRQSGNTVLGRPFLDAAKAEADKTLGIHERQDRERPNKVGSPRSGGIGNGGDGKRGAYEDLPSEAKRQCEKDIKSGLIKFGKGKRHESADSYRKSFADLYNSQE